MWSEAAIFPRDQWTLLGTGLRTAPGDFRLATGLVALSRAYPRPVNQGPISRYNIEIHQAAGMVSIQADCELEQSYALMSDRAKLGRVSLDDIALAVIDRSICFARSEGLPPTFAEVIIPNPQV